MSHETNSGTSPERAKSIVSFKSSFWLAVIIVGLFIASLNFIQVMSKGEEGEKKEAGTEQAAGAVENKVPVNNDKPAAEAIKEDDAKAITPKTEDKPATAAPAEHK